MEGQTNPLTRFFGVGWYGLIATNALIIAGIIAAYAFYVFKYRSEKTAQTPDNVWQYISLLYFGKPGQLHKILYKMPVNRRALIAHTGFALLWTVIVGSILATVHNLCQYYEVSFYDNFREVVKRPLFVIYGLLAITLSLSTYLVWQDDYSRLYPEKSPNADSIL